MILFTIIAAIVFMFVLFGGAALTVGGAAFLAVFADVIVCAVFLGLIIKAIVKKK